MEMVSRKCCSCKQDFDESEFIGKNGRTRYPHCLECRNKKSRDSHHRRKHGDKHRKYLEATREKRNKYCREWYEANKETEKAERIKYYKKNKDLILARSKQWYAQNKRQYRDLSLQRRFGITIKQYEEMLASQNNSCAICKTPQGDIALAVDHCHTTGKVRSLLCSDCNTMLGLCNDNTTVLQSAIRYLENH